LTRKFDVLIIICVYLKYFSIEKLHALIVKIHEFISSKIDNIVTRATDYSDGYEMFDAAAAEPTTVSPHRDLVTPTLPF
jgi:hypothetical protein